MHRIPTCTRAVWLDNDAIMRCADALPDEPLESYKNPHSYRNVTLTAEEAVEMIILANPESGDNVNDAARALGNICRPGAFA